MKENNDLVYSSTNIHLGIWNRNTTTITIIIGGLKTMTERTIVIYIDSEIGNRLYRLIQILMITFPYIIKEKVKL